MKDLEQRLKNEAFIQRLEKSGVKVESLKESMKVKNNGKEVLK